MKKNTKIFALVMSIAMLFSAFSLTAFAADFHYEENNYNLFSDYRCNTYVDFVRSQMLLNGSGSLSKTVDSTVKDKVRVYTQGVITYKDYTFDIGQNSSEEYEIWLAGDTVSAGKRVYGNTSKEVYSLSIDNDYSVNGITKAMVYDFYAGTDF